MCVLTVSSSKQATPSELKRAGASIGERDDERADGLDPAFMNALEQMLANADAMDYADRVLEEAELGEVCLV